MRILRLWTVSLLTMNSADFRHLPVRFGTGAHSQRRAVASQGSTGPAQHLRCRDGSEGKGSQGGSTERRALRQLLAVFAPEAKTKKIELVLEIGDSLDRSGIRVIKTDHVRLGQIMTNLVSNAIRFTELSALRRIVVRLDVSYLPPQADTCAPPPLGEPAVSEGDVPVWFFVAISDTGPGLTPEECALLFQQFSRE